MQYKILFWRASGPIISHPITPVSPIGSGNPGGGKISPITPVTPVISHPGGGVVGAETPISQVTRAVAGFLGVLLVSQVFNNGYTDRQLCSDM